MLILLHQHDSSAAKSTNGGKQLQYLWKQQAVWDAFLARMSHFPRLVYAVLSFNYGISGTIALLLSDPGSHRLSVYNAKTSGLHLLDSIRSAASHWWCRSGGSKALIRTQISWFQMVQLLLTVSGADCQSPAKGALFQDICYPLQKRMPLALKQLSSASFAAIIQLLTANACISTADSYCRVASSDGGQCLRGVREGGCGNVPVVNYTVDSW